MQVTVLGCGSSVGVPVIGCNCEVCLSDDIKNKRSRSAIIIEDKQKRILVDFGADIREQLIREKIKQLDSVILTHDHADHVNGIDDLKIFAFYNKKPLPIYSDSRSLEYITARFFYMFNSPDKHDHWGMQRLTPHEINYDQKYEISGMNLQFFRQHHGRIDSLGIRIGDFVYSSDVVDFPETSEQYLYDADIWMVDCIEYQNTLAHAGLESILKWNEKFRPQKMILTNMSHKFDYNVIKSELPTNITPAYDGMKLKL